MSDDNVWFSYSSWSNVSFHGKMDSGYSKEEWVEMNVAEQDSIIDEALWSLVDIGVDE